MKHDGHAQLSGFLQQWGQTLVIDAQQFAILVPQG